MTNVFALNHDKSLQIYFCVKRQAENDFLKAVENRIVCLNMSSVKHVIRKMKQADREKMVSDHRRSV